MTRRLQSLQLSNFRSIAGDWDIPLDADVVLVHGLNGAGKTSFLSAIELAATGTIAHLDRSRDSSYLSHLIHKGTASGHVSLTTSDVSNHNGAPKIGVSPTGISGDPLLDPDMASFFSERCFLPQTTLGRLLEIYAPGDAPESQSSLVNFVKGLVGLDALDSLIEGLDASGHIARAVKLTSSWSYADLRLQGLRIEEDKARKESMSIEKNRQSARETLREILGAEGEDEAGLVDQAEAEIRLFSPSREIDLRGMELQLRALSETLKDLPDSSLLDSVSVESAEAALLEWWEKGDGKRLLAEINRLSTELGLDTWQSETWSGLANEIDVALETSASDARSAIEARESLETVRDLGLSGAYGTEIAIAEQRSRLEQLNVSPDVRELVELLAIALPLVRGDTCPLCDQSFRGGEDALRTHVEAKIARLSEVAQRALELETEIRTQSAALESAQTAADRAIAELTLVPPTSELKDRLAQLTDSQIVWQRLRLLRSRSHDLEVALQSARTTEAQNARSRQLRDQVEEGVSQIAAALALSPSESTLSGRLGEVSTVLNATLKRTSAAEERRDRLIAAVDELASLREKAHAATTSLKLVQRQKAELQNAIKEATRRKESASSLRKTAERVRSATMRGVFDDNLNQSWRDFFQRLAPLEPFVPQFKRDDRSSRTVNIELETIDREGKPAASPGTMLSYGNVNTAALSLFLSLHFAVSPILPWLILDDPIQSMDDIHVANFASLLKQLTRTRGRQVVVAVHQRELFDYLKLELTPAGPSQEVLAITIEKRDETTTDISRERLTYTEDTSIGLAS